jgi:hypothetical protein|tara:strand:- start:1243 stop:1545 length:303 start_codon:yes stop_codon:yes gene_type:complete
MSYTTIKDENLEPYFIQKDQHCYTVFENVKPQGKRAIKSKTGKSYIKSVGHYGNFGQAIKAICIEKLNQDEKEYSSVKEYLTEWENIQTEIKQLVKQPNI